MGYAEDLDYEIELAGGDLGPDKAAWRAFAAAYASAVEELALSMAEEHVKLLCEESEYYHNSLEEQQRLVSEGKTNDNYITNAKYPFRPLSRLWLRVRKMAARALGDARPLILPPEVAKVYIEKQDYSITEHECAGCGYEVPWGLGLTYPLFEHCPACGRRFWPQGKQPWSEANPDKSVDVFVWRNGSFAAGIDALIEAKFGKG